MIKQVGWTLVFLGCAYADHGTSAFGTLAYPASFTQFQHTPQQNVPRDGRVVWGSLSSFNTFNPFVVRGSPAPLIGLLCFARLLDDPYDEVGSGYAYAAEDVETAPDFTWVKFRLRPNLTFSDGTPITANDVAFSFQMICDNHPMKKNYYRHIAQVEVLDQHTILFHCPDNVSHEIAGILGQIPILPQAFFAHRDPGAPLSEPMPSSGPYAVESFNMGDFIQLKRQDNWWGTHVPSQKGKYNVLNLRLNVFRDATVLVEALLAGTIDMCIEQRIKIWEESYKGAPFDTKRVCKSELPHADCAATSGMFFNTRRPIFADTRVRQAISLMVNGHWLNVNLYQGRYKRCNSYFSNSVLAHKGVPEGEEKAVLEPFRQQLPASIWTTAPTEGDDAYDPETRRKKALELLSQAGWHLKDGRMMKDHTHFSFEILINSKANEKLVLHLKSMLQTLGIHVNVRIVERVVYEEKLDHHDYDMVLEFVEQSLMPGNEQMSYWGSTSVQQTGTKNYAGINNPVVDALCEQLLKAKSYKKLCTYVHALDRVLMHHHYIIPRWYFDRALIGHKPRVKWMQPQSEHQVVRWLFETMWVEDAAVVQPEEVATQSTMWKRFVSWIKKLTATR